MSVRRKVYGSKDQEKFTNAFDDQNFAEMSKLISLININAIFFDRIGRSWGRTYLVEALNDERAEMVKFLIENGADPKVRCNAKSPLFYAITKEMPKMVEILLDHKVDLKDVDSEGTSALVLALRKKPPQDEIVKTIIRYGVQSEDPAQATYYKFCDSLLKSDFETAKTLIEKSEGEDLTSFMEFAISENCVPVIQLLLDKGANLDESTLNSAIQMKNLSLVRLLIQSKVNVNSPDFKMTPLYHAYSVCDNNESLVMMKMILEAGAKVDALVFHDACTRGRLKVVQLLTKYSPDSIDFFEKETGQTSLHKAIHHPEIVLFLAQRGASIDAVDLEKETPLHKACRAGQFSSVQILFEHRADLSLADKHNKTILHHFANRDEEQFAWILHHTVDREILSLDERDENGNTALHYAGPKCFNFAELMKRGADFNVRNNVQKCPIHFHVTDKICLVWEFEERLRFINCGFVNYTTCFHRNQDPSLVSFYTLELAELQRQKISEDQVETLYDLLLLPKFIVNDELERLHNECHLDFQTKYPYYGCLLNMRYRHHRRNMMECHS